MKRMHVHVNVEVLEIAGDVPVMLSPVWIANRSQGWAEARAKSVFSEIEVQGRA